MSWNYHSNNELKDLINSMLNRALPDFGNQFEEFATSVAERIVVGKSWVQLKLVRRFFGHETSEEEIREWHNNILQHVLFPHEPSLKTIIHCPNSLLMGVVIYAAIDNQSGNETLFEFIDYTYSDNFVRSDIPMKYNSYEELKTYFTEILGDILQIEHDQIEELVTSAIGHITEVTPHVSLTVFKKIFERSSSMDEIENWQNDILKCANPDTKKLKAIVDTGDSTAVGGVVIDLDIDNQRNDALLEFTTLCDITILATSSGQHRLLQ